MAQKFSFGEALELLRQGKAVCRTGWNGKGMFIFMRPADELSKEFIVNSVKSLPQVFKDYVERNPQESYKFMPYLCMKAADNTITNGWNASQIDMMAEDWEIFE